MNKFSPKLMKFFRCIPTLGEESDKERISSYVVSALRYFTFDQTRAYGHIRSTRFVALLTNYGSILYLKNNNVDLLQRLASLLLLYYYRTIVGKVGLFVLVAVIVCCPFR